MSTRIVEERNTFEDWQTQLKLACEADRRDDIAAIVSLRMPPRMVRRHRTILLDAPEVQMDEDSICIDLGDRRTVYEDRLIPGETMYRQENCPPLQDLPEPGSDDAHLFLHHLLRNPWQFSGSCLFWVRSLEALRLLEEAGASIEDTGWMEVPLLIHMAEKGQADIVRFLIEERGHDHYRPC